VNEATFWGASAARGHTKDSGGTSTGSGPAGRPANESCRESNVSRSTLPGRKGLDRRCRVRERPDVAVCRIDPVCSAGIGHGEPGRADTAASWLRPATGKLPRRLNAAARVSAGVPVLVAMTVIGVGILRTLASHPSTTSPPGGSEPSPTVADAPLAAPLPLPPSATVTYLEPARREAPPDAGRGPIETGPLTKIPAPRSAAPSAAGRGAPRPAPPRVPPARGPASSASNRDELFELRRSARHEATTRALAAAEILSDLQHCVLCVRPTGLRREDSMTAGRPLLRCDR
jgi:hypothetical protein